MAYWVYMRVSTRTQAEKNSTENQREGINKYVADHNITVAGAFSDEGVSGAIDRTADDDAIYKREGLIELLGTANEGDTIIVQNTSRLWRSDTAKVLIRRELMKSKLHVISVDNPDYDLYTKDPVEMLMNGIMEMLDEYEKMNIAIKLARGRVARARTGNKPCGTCPIGYKWVGNEVKIDAETAPTVCEIFRLYIETRSLRRTGRELTARGHLSNQGNEFSDMSLKKIIQNDFYIGVVTHGTVKVEGHHKPLIEKEVWDEANAILHRPRATKHHKQEMTCTTRYRKPRKTPEELVAEIEAKAAARRAAEQTA